MVRNMFKNIKRNFGFTLMEVIIVVAIIAVMLGLGAVGISQYIKDADRNERNAAAEIIFMSLQSNLVQRQKDGTLQEFNDLVDAYQGTPHLVTLLDYREAAAARQDTHMGNILSKNGLQLNTTYKEKHDGTQIVSVFYDGTKDRTTSLYNMLFSLGVDDEYLDNKIIFEYNQTTGVVQAVFYSKEEGIAFNLASYQTGDLLAKNNLLLRDDDSLEEKNQGYYGLYDTSAVSEKIKETIESSVQLVNDDRVYLVFEETLASSEHGHGPQLTIDLIGEQTKSYKVNWNNNGGNQHSNGTISSLVDTLANLDASSKNKDTLQGYFYKLKDDNKALCIILLSSEKEDRMSKLTLDGVFGATPEKSEFYCRLSSSTSGLTANSNAINPVFAGYDSAKEIYSISCVRHVMNMTRLDALKQQLSGALNRPDEARFLHYQVTDDINFCQYEREEHTVLQAVSHAMGKSVAEVLAMSDVANSNGNLHFLENLSVADVAFNETDTNKTIHLKKGLFPLDFDRNVDLQNTGNIAAKRYFKGVFESDTAAAPHTISGIYINGEKTGERCNGFFRENEGTIQNLKFANAVLLTMSRSAVVCGQNRGVIANVSVTHFLIAQELESESETKKEDGRQCLDYIVEIPADNNKVGEMGTNGDSVADYTPSYLGGIAGTTTKPIVSCNVEDGIIYAYDAISGGIVGYSSYASTSAEDYALDGCSTTNCFIVATAKVGGIVGHADGIVNNCHTRVKDGGKIAATNLLVYRNTTAENQKSLLAQDGYSRYNSRLIIPMVCCYRNSARGGGIAGFTGDSILNCSNEALVLQRFIDINDAFKGDRTAGVGGIVGLTKSKNANAIIQNCENRGLVVAYNSHMDKITICARFIGGIAGASFSNMDNCKNYAEVKAYNAHTVGGIAGGCAGNMTKCENYASVSARESVGGIVGVFNGSKMEDCVNGGTLAADGTISVVEHVKYEEQWGGLIKGTSTMEQPTITCTFSDVDVSKANFGANGTNDVGYVGGLVGICNAGTYVPATKTFTTNTLGATLKNCYNGDLVTIGVGNGSKPQRVQYLGGLVGYAKSGITIENAKNFADIDLFKNWGETLPANCVGGVLGYGKSFVNLTNVANLGKEMSFKTLYVTKTGENNPELGIGGLIGHADGKTTCTDVTNRASIYFDGNASDRVVRCVGGVAGYVVKDFICENITSNCEIKVKQAAKFTEYIGGVAGYVGGNFTCKKSISESEIRFVGAVTVKSAYIGGVAGYVLLSADINQVSSSKDIIMENQGMLKCVGGIIGYVRQNGYFTDVHYGTNLLNAGVTASEPKIECKGVMDHCAGIVGYVDGNASFKDTTSTCYLHRDNWGGSGTMLNHVGGVAGQIYRDASFVNVWNAGKIEGNGDALYLGGVVGCVGKKDGSGEGIFTGDGLFNTGDIQTTGTMQYVGGIAGSAMKGLSLSVGSNAGNIISTTWEKCTYVGGVVGLVNAGDVAMNIYNNYGKISSNGVLDHAAGIVGQVANGNLTLTSITNYGKIETAGNCNYVAGIVGETKGSVTLTNVANIKVAGLDAPDIKTTGGILDRVGGIAGRINGVDEAHIVNMEGVVNEASIYAAGSSTRVAGIVGEILLAPTSIKDVTTYGEIGMKNYVSLQYAGGIVGHSTAPLAMENVHNTYDEKHSYNGRTNNVIEAQTDMKYVGGLVGQSEKAVSLVSGDNTANIWMSGYGAFQCVGGLFGEVKIGLSVTAGSNGGVILNNSTSNSVKQIAGLCGNCTGNVEIYNSSNSGAISIAGASNTDLYIAGLCGNCSGTLTITDSNNALSGTITVGRGQFIAGVVGNVAGAATLQKVTNQGNITLTTEWATFDASNSNNHNKYIAGIVGRTQQDGTLTNVTNEGTIEAKGDLQYGAGIVGYASKGQYTLNIVHNNGAVIAKGMKQCGGVVGQFADDVNLVFSMDQVYNHAMIHVTSNTANDIGGLLGKGGKTSILTIANSENEGTIWLQSTSDASNIGGMVGLAQSNPLTMRDVKNTGNIASDYNLTSAGGIIGQANGNCVLKVKNVYSSGSITAANGNLTSVGGCIGNCAGQMVREFFNMTAEGTIQGRNLSQVGGLIGYLNSEVDSYINGTVDNATENTADYKAVKVNIQSMGDASTWATTVGGLFGKIEVAGRFTIRNYSYEGTLSSENLGVTGIEWLVGNNHTIDMTTYHLRYYTTVTFDAADVTDVYRWEDTSEGKYVFGGNRGSSATTEDHTIVFVMPAGNTPNGIKLGDTALTVTITQDVDDTTKYSFVLPAGTSGGALSVEYSPTP